MNSALTKTVDSTAGETQERTGFSLIPDAIIGIVDIVSSTQISNYINLHVEWRLIEEFNAASRRRALAMDITIVNTTGDGFSFLAESSAKGMANVRDFHRALVRDFRELLGSIGDHLDGIESGLRIGVAAGPTIIGKNPESGGQLRIVGPVVILAARLCAKAGVNELAVSSLAWKNSGVGAAGGGREERHADLKGIECAVSALHFSIDQFDSPEMPSARTTSEIADFLGSLDVGETRSAA